MLWQKENDIYKDICINSKYGSGQVAEIYNGYIKLMAEEKNNELSTVFRNMGDDIFKTKIYYETIRFYNESLVFAENDSFNVGWAYAHRSLCFFKIKLYDKCLIDIELAIKAGCSDNLEATLKLCKADCLKLMKNNVPAKVAEPKLDFDADKRFSCLANVLQIEKTDDGEQIITAKQNIPAGSVVLVEKPFLNIPFQCRDICATCLMGWTNLVPCRTCTTTLFCKGECEANSFHKYECGKVFMPDDADNQYSIFVFRSVLFAVNNFPDVESLMDFVEQVLSNINGKNSPKLNPIIDHLKYATFLQSSYNNKIFKDLEFPMKVHSVYKILLDEPAVQSKFESQKDMRFLLNLVGHHSCIIRSNSTSIIPNLINHLSTPNVDLIPLANHNICVTMRPIEKFEQLYLSYFQYEPRTQNLVSQQRQQRFQFLYDVECRCDRCCSKFFISSEFEAIKTNPLFIYHRRHVKKPCIQFDAITTKEFFEQLWSQLME